MKLFLYILLKNTFLIAFESLEYLLEVLCFCNEPMQYHSDLEPLQMHCKDELMHSNLQQLQTEGKLHVDKDPEQPFYINLKPIESYHRDHQDVSPS